MQKWKFQDAEPPDLICSTSETGNSFIQWFVWLTHAITCITGNDIQNTNFNAYKRLFVEEMLSESEETNEIQGTIQETSRKSHREEGSEGLTRSTDA